MKLARLTNSLGYPMIKLMPKGKRVGVKGTSPLLVLITVLILAIAVYWLLKNNRPTTTPTESTPAKQVAAPLKYEDILAMGGVCFNKPITDEVGDVEGQGENSPYDIEKVSLGRQGENLVVQWDLAGAVPADSRHNLRFWIGHDVGAADDDKIEIAWAAKDQVWTTSLTSGDGKDTKNFDPQASTFGNSIRYQIPLNLIENNGQIDGLSFTLFSFNKETSASYNDTIWPPKEKQVAGQYTAFYCSQLN